MTMSRRLLQMLVLLLITGLLRARVHDGSRQRTSSHIARHHSGGSTGIIASRGWLSCRLDQTLDCLVTRRSVASVGPPAWKPGPKAARSAACMVCGFWLLWGFWRFCISLLSATINHDTTTWSLYYLPTLVILAFCDSRLFQQQDNALLQVRLRLEAATPDGASPSSASRTDARHSSRLSRSRISPRTSFDITASSKCVSDKRLWRVIAGSRVGLGGRGRSGVQVH
jgi:hypothetical protein